MQSFLHVRVAEPAWADRYATVADDFRQQYSAIPEPSRHGLRYNFKTQTKETKVFTVRERPVVLYFEVLHA